MMSDPQSQVQTHKTFSRGRRWQSKSLATEEPHAISSVLNIGSREKEIGARVNPGADTKLDRWIHLPTVQNKNKYKSRGGQMWDQLFKTETSPGGQNRDRLLFAVKDDCHDPTGTESPTFTTLCAKMRLLLSAWWTATWERDECLCWVTLSCGGTENILKKKQLKSSRKKNEWSRHEMLFKRSVRSLPAPSTGGRTESKGERWEAWSRYAQHKLLVFIFQSGDVNQSVSRQSGGGIHTFLRLLI